DGGLSAAGDEQDLLDAVRHQLLDHVLDDGLAGHREHFLGLRLGGRQQPRPLPGDRNNRAFDHILTISAASALYWAKKKRSMEDIQQQLAALRLRVAGIDRKYASAPRDERPARRFIEELMSGEVVTTPYGEHFETEKVWERHRRHGSMDIADLAELPEDLLGPLSAGTVARTHPLKWAFL